MCFLTFKWQIFVINTLWTLFNFPLFLVIIFSDYLSKNAIDLENSFFFFLLDSNCFNWNEMFLIWKIFI